MNPVRNLLRKILPKEKEKEKGEEAVAAPEKPPRKWWQFPFKVTKTSRGGPNMPKFRRCPMCYARSRRTFKSEGGAYYQCRLHGEFFVRAT